MKRNSLALSLVQRLLLLLCLFIFCYGLTSVLIFLLSKVLAERPLPLIRISAIVQDILTFIFPALLTALFVTRQSAKLLCLTLKPNILMIALSIAVLVLSIPMQQSIIYWNYHISLPPALSHFEVTAHALETKAFEVMKTMLESTQVLSLIANVLIIGVAAGFAEELFFRGCLQRLLTTGGVNHHIAIWVVAIIFSVMHMQFFGFVPRMLLGAYFGYLLYWTRSIWVPMLAHMLNNTMFVVSSWLTVRSEGIEAITPEPELMPSWLVVASVIFTIAGLYALYRNRTQVEPNSIAQ